MSKSNQDSDSERIDNTQIRLACIKYVQQGKTWGEICKRLGWMKPRYTRPGEQLPLPDVVRLKRTIGLAEIKSVHGDKVYTYYTRTITYKNAVLIVRALDRDPVEFGI